MNCVIYNYTFDHRSFGGECPQCRGMEAKLGAEGVRWVQRVISMRVERLADRVLDLERGFRRGGEP